MKIKNCFVSNSSSASFILTWRLPEEYTLYKNWKEKKTNKRYSSIEDAVEEFFSDWKYKNAKDAKGVALIKQQREDIVKHSKIIDEDSGLCQSDFWTVMYNDTDDFGQHVQKFATELVARELFVNGKIIEIY
jgi:hypothetical protein